MAPKKDLTTEEMQLLEQYFLKEYSNMLYVAQLSLANSQLAGDAVQEVFLTVVKHFDKFRVSENPTGWLYKALKYQVMHMNRDWYLAINRAEELTDSMAVPSQPLDESPILVGPEIRTQMELLLRFYVEGYTIKELAQEENCSIGAMKMRIKRARDSVKKFWDKHHE